MGKSKKIGFYLTSTGFGGLEMNAINLGIWLKERKWDIYFFTIRDSRIQAAAEEAGLVTHIVERPNKYIDIRNAFRLSNFLNSYSIDNLIIFDNHDLSTANYCKQFFKRRLKMIYLQQMQFKVKKTSPAHTFRFSGLDFWISPLESLKKQVLRTTKVPEKKIVVIPLCLETDRYLNNPYSKDEARQILQIDSKNPFIGVLGRIAPTKGQLGVIRALNKLKNELPNLNLIIMGEPTINEPACLEYDKECHDYVKKNGLENRVHFRPFRKDVELFYAAADIFIMCSKKETFGMVTVEAMLSGIPVIGTNSGGTPELLNQGEFGQLYQFENDAELSEKIENILLEKFNYSEMAKNARNYAKTTYDKNTMCEAIEALLE